MRHGSNGCISITGIAARCTRSRKQNAKKTPLLFEWGLVCSDVFDANVLGLVIERGGYAVEHVLTLLVGADLIAVDKDTLEARRWRLDHLRLFCGHVVKVGTGLRRQPLAGVELIPAVINGIDVAILPLGDDLPRLGAPLLAGVGRDVTLGDERAELGGACRLDE